MADMSASIPPFSCLRVPVTPVLSGNPVKLVATPLVGVPNIGVVKVGLTARTGAPVPVTVVQTGAVEAPPPTNISVVNPAATTSTAEAALPITKPPSANVDTPVPPCATATSVPSQVPELIVPTVVAAVVTKLGIAVISSSR